MVPVPPVEVGEVIAGKYQVDSVIGQGGMGIVVAAHHVGLDQRVAIKFLLADIAQDADAAERFRREGRAVAQIQSDHVVRVLDVGWLRDDVPFMVMEYLEGRDLRQKLSSEGPLGIEEAVGYALETIDAIAEAHRAGIVHRDLKPANLFLANRPDGSIQLKVLDFGISKSLLDSSINSMRLTSTTTLIGSPLYMSPEQMQSARDVDARADIWSLGAILFEMLAGRPPYQANSFPQLCDALLNTEPPSLRELRPDVPEALDRAVALCLKRSLNERWSTAVALGGALAPFAPQHRGLPVLHERSEASSIGKRHDDEPSTRTGTPNPGTLNPWGKTQARKRQRNRALGALALVLLVTGVLGFRLLLPRLNSGAVHTAASAHSEGATSLSEAASPSVAREQPGSDGNDEEQTGPVIAPAETRAEAAGSASASVSATGLTVEQKARPQAPPVLHEPRPAVTLAAPPASGGNKPAPDDAVPDFGGRR